MINVYLYDSDGKLLGTVQKTLKYMDEHEEIIMRKLQSWVRLSSVQRKNQRSPYLYEAQMLLSQNDRNTFNLQPKDLIELR